MSTQRRRSICREQIMCAPQAIAVHSGPCKSTYRRRPFFASWTLEKMVRLGQRFPVCLLLCTISFAVMGAPDPAASAQQDEIQVYTDDINKRGGVLGHKLSLVFHDDKTANDNANPDVTATAQCQDWTRDRPVFAGINVVGDRNRDSFFSCMATHALLGPM